MKIQIINYRPPRLAQLSILIAMLLHWASPLGELYIYSNSFVGILLGLSNFGIMMWAWWLFKQFNTAIEPTSKTDHLITSGIYRLSRNPMYLGMVGMLLALAFLVGTLPFYLTVVVYFLVLNYVFCPYEENKLSDTFGHTYLSYKNQVRRWL